MTKNTKKVLLTILDGWGISKEHKEFDAVEMGKTTTWHNLVKNNLSANLITFGEEVGLPEGQMGNSEVGHTNIGAGRVVYQELPKINKSIKEGTFAKNEQIISTLNLAKKNNSTVHIMGLYSDGGVHSHMSHLLHSAELFATHHIKVVLHLFLDGRDTPPRSAITFAPEVNKLLSKHNNIKIGCISGRYYAMDRDNRWDRVELAYNAIVCGQSDKVNSYNEALESAYKQETNDEFVKPVVHTDYKGMQDSDILFMINFRSDRARQILNALVDKDFSEFKRSKVINFSYALGMVPYSDALNKCLHTVFPSTGLPNTLAQWLATNNCTQLRVAETEKYPHVTFFFSGGIEKNFTGEDRILVPSPKVATYDLKPEMSAFEITDKLCNVISTKKYDFIVVNYANGDMVGHTGVLDAAIKATESVDSCLAKLEKYVKDNDYIWLIIADHGNCETMWDFDNNVAHTQHTTNLVPMVLVNCPAEYGVKVLQNGKLADVAPTILSLMNLAIPKEMDGKSLLKK